MIASARYVVSCRLFLPIFGIFALFLILKYGNNYFTSAVFELPPIMHVPGETSVGQMLTDFQTHVGPRWYTTTNVGQYAAYVGVALASAAKNSDVSPRFILSSSSWPSSTLKKIVEASGIRVIVHDSNHAKTLASAASKLFPNDANAIIVALGTFVRFDVPALAASETLKVSLEWIFKNPELAADQMAALPEEDVVLYTDPDVVFEPGSHLSRALARGELSKPSIFALQSEIDVTNYADLNSGVILFRVSGFLREYNSLWAAFERNNYECMRNAWDQGCLRIFAGERGLMSSLDARLPPQWNWRPYLFWPKDTIPQNSPIYLIHFHGPKPLNLAQFVVGLNEEESSSLNQKWFQPTYQWLWSKNPQGMSWAFSRWALHFHKLVK